MSRRLLNQRAAARRLSGRPDAKPDPAAFLIAQINEVSKTARTSWFGLMSYLAFVGVTLLGVSDADLFMTERETVLPLIGVTIPTLTFFWVAPALGMLLYAYLHLYLVKLWDYMADAPPVIDNTPLADAISPWLLTDYALAHRTDGATALRPLREVASLATLSFAFLAGPLVIGGLWFRSMPRHDEWLTMLGCGLPFTLTLFIGLQSWRNMRKRMRGQRHTPQPLVKQSFGLLLVAVSMIGWFTTEGTLDRYLRIYLGWSDDQIAASPFRGTDRFLVSANLENVQFVALPDDWQPQEQARREFQIAWCHRHDIPQSLCAGETVELSEPAKQTILLNWCKGWVGVVGPDHLETCAAELARYHSAADQTFAAAWRQRIMDLPDRNLDGADLRNSNLFGAQLQGANLVRAQLQGAYLRGAQLQGANLVWAQLQGANLNGAELQGAILFRAKLQGADLTYAQLQGAYLYFAQLQGADLSVAQFDESTNLSAATLSGAALQAVDDITVSHFLPYLDQIFGDSSVPLPADTPWPAHWGNQRGDPPLDPFEFNQKWRAWQAEFHPDTLPEGYEP